METLTEFETRLALSAPQPREGFEQALAQQLGREFTQRHPAAQVQTAARQRRSGRLSARSAAILVAILVIGVGVVIAMSAVLQRILRQDAGLEAILEQGLGHEIGISQTHEGFTVTLEWAYADGNRLSLAYMIEGEPGAQYSNLWGRVFSLHLRDTGQEIPASQGMTALIDRDGEVVDADPNGGISTADRSLSIFHYDLSGIDTSASPTLNLRLEVAAYGVTLQQRTRLPIEQFNAMMEGPYERFVFDFSLALVDDQRLLDSAPTATDQDITLTLQRVSVSPSQTLVLVCFPPPDPARQWTAVPRLTTQDGDVPGAGGVRHYQDNGRACSDFTYYAGMADYSGVWRLEITELVGFGSGGGDDQQRIAGSWVFEFSVPS